MRFIYRMWLDGRRPRWVWAALRRYFADRDYYKFRRARRAAREQAWDEKRASDG